MSGGRDEREVGTPPAGGGAVRHGSEDSGASVAPTAELTATSFAISTLGRSPLAYWASIVAYLGTSGVHNRTQCDNIDMLSECGARARLMTKQGDPAAIRSLSGADMGATVRADRDRAAAVGRCSQLMRSSPTLSKPVRLL